MIEIISRKTGFILYSADVKTYAEALESAVAHQTDLSFADLENVDLVNANLSGANLTGANLVRTDLSSAILNNTNLGRAICQSTKFANLNFSSVKGLDTIRHLGPSEISVSTLYKSGNSISEVFLKGCGVPEGLIDFLPSLINSANAIDFYSCFISYSHVDKSFARRLHDQLQAKGIRCWLDDHQILPGDNIYCEVDRGIKLWDKVLLCASENSLTSGWVDDELKHAFAKEKKLFKERGHEVLSVVPIDLDGYIFEEWEHPKKNQLMERLVVSFKGWEKENDIFEREFERIVKALRSDDFAREKPPEPKL